MSSGTNSERITQNNSIISENNSDIDALKTRIQNLPTSGDTTATAGDILRGKTAISKGVKLTGTYTPPVPYLQNKQVTISQNGLTVITPDTGYDGIDYVEANVSVPSSGGEAVVSKLRIYTDAQQMSDALLNEYVAIGDMAYIRIDDTPEKMQQIKPYDGLYIPKYFSSDDIINTQGFANTPTLFDMNQEKGYMPSGWQINSSNASALFDNSRISTYTQEWLHMSTNTTYIFEVEYEWDGTQTQNNCKRTKARVYKEVNGEQVTVATVDPATDKMSFPFYIGLHFDMPWGMSWVSEVIKGYTTQMTDDVRLAKYTQRGNLDYVRYIQQYQ